MIIWDGTQLKALPIFLKYSETVFGASVLKPKQIKNCSEEKIG